MEEVNSVEMVVIQNLTDVLIQKLTDMINDDKKIIGQKAIVDQLHEIRDGLKKLRGFFTNDYLKFLCYVEDTIETFAIHIFLKRKRPGFLIDALSFKNFTAYKNLKREIGKVKKIIKDLEDKKERNERQVQNPSVGSPTEPVKGSPTLKGNRMLISKRSTSYSYKAKELGIVGSDKHTNKLIELLTKGDHQIIPLVGENGSGKTTLAHAIRATKEMKEHFHSSFAWVTIDEDSLPEDILLNLLKRLDISIDKNPIELLIERLNQHRFLIVLDNLSISNLLESSTQGNSWVKMKDAFLGNTNGTKIIITTRDEKVAESANSSYSLNLEKLNDKDVLDLFQQKAGSICPVDLKPNILKICNGLPLNVVLLGSLLSTKEPATWKNDEKWQKSSSVLGLSYDDVSSEGKLCLLYMVLFPTEYDIPVRRLLRLWLAEGFIKQPDSNENRTSEDKVNECFDNLIQRSLILITNQRSDGGHRKCRLLGAMHEYLSPKANAIKFFHVHKNKVCLADSASKEARRLVEFVEREKCSFSESSKLRSYLSFNFQKKDIPATEVGVLLSDMLKRGFSLLRVLDLEGVYKPSLPDNLGNFFQLRYLGLRWTFLDHLPSSVGDLTYLETLDLKHTNVNSLPASVWKLKHLRHLNLDNIRLDLPVTSNDSFPSLLTLCGLSIVDGECRVKNGLDRLSHLRELDLTFQLKNCGELLDWVSGLTSLEQLRLRSKDYVGHPATLSYKPLAKLTALSHMNLLGSLPMLPTHDKFPQNLKVLTLSVSRLQTDPMQTLGQLEHLTVLRLLANSYLGKKMLCLGGGFRELRVLKLWMLTNLEDWELEGKCMEKLNELNIRCCQKLKCVPTKLLEQMSFKELILNNMPEEFKIKVEESKKKADAEKLSHFSVIVKNYEFTPRPSEEQENDNSEVTHSDSLKAANDEIATSKEKVEMQSAQLTSLSEDLSAANAEVLSLKSQIESRDNLEMAGRGWWRWW